MQKTNAMPSKAETTTSVHESKHFPFVIIEQTTIKNEKETKTFRIGLAGSIVSEKTFKSLESAEKYIASKPYDLIINLVGTTIKLMKEDEKYQS